MEMEAWFTCTRFCGELCQFEKNITMVNTTCHVLYPNPNDGHQNLFCQVVKGYWNRVQEQFHFGTHLDGKQFNLQREVVCTNVFNLE
jgi:hypothetical protein